MRYPLLAPLAAIATGILVSRAVPFDLRDLPIIIAVFAALAVVALRRNPVLSGACCLLAMAFAGILSDVWHRPGPRPELDVNGRELAILAGCVADSPVADEGRVRFTLELEPGVRVRTTLYLPEGEPVPVLHYGQRVEVDARVRRTRNFQNPGAFDYSTYLARRSIFWTASASAVRVQPGVCGTRAAAFIYGLRSSALARLEQLYAGKPYETGMMQGILIGESARMDKVWTEHFRSTGTIHALVISGTHVAILSAFFLFLLRLCLVKESRAMFLTVIAGWLYALVTGWEAPVIRSAAGLTLFLAGRLAFRERRIVNLLAAIGIAFLVCDPRADAGGELSTLVPGRWIHRRVRRAAARRHLGPAGPGARRPSRYRARHAPGASRRAVSRGGAAAGGNARTLAAAAAPRVSGRRRRPRAHRFLCLRTRGDLGGGCRSGWHCPWPSTSTVFRSPAFRPMS